MGWSTGGAGQGAGIGAEAGSALGPWGTLIGGGIGGLAGGLFGGGDEKSPLRKFRDFWGDMLYNPHGLMQANQRDISNWDKTYGQVLKNFGVAGKQRIKDWEANQGAATGQSLANRGLYNTTVMDAEQNAIGAQGTRMRQDLAERKGNVLLARQGQRQALHDKAYGWQQLLATGPGGLSSQAPGQGGGVGWEQMFGLLSGQVNQNGGFGSLSQFLGNV